MHWKLVPVFLVFTIAVGAQSRDQQRRMQVDSLLFARYYDNGNLDTAYITRPTTKWTVVARMNVSGAKIEAEGLENGHHFNSEMRADYKSTLSMAVSYLGFSISGALNPAKLMGKYRDYELNFNSYGKRFGFDFIYQNAKNFTGWHDTETGGPSFPQTEHTELPAGILKVKTLNLNAFYVFNSRRFSYPAAFTQSYIQRQSAGSFLLAASGQGQHGTVSGNLNSLSSDMEFKMTNIGIGAGYGYNYVPSKRWLLHISALPTFIVYSNTSMTFGDNRVPLHYHFPEAIITGRGSVSYQWKNKFLGMSMVFNFTNIGDMESLAIHNIKWRVRAFFGLRL